jgi:hypothetical protein
MMPRYLKNSVHLDALIRYVQIQCELKREHSEAAVFATLSYLIKNLPDTFKHELNDLLSRQE